MGPFIYHKVAHIKWTLRRKKFEAYRLFSTYPIFNWRTFNICFHIFSINKNQIYIYTIWKIIAFQHMFKTTSFSYIFSIPKIGSWNLVVFGRRLVSFASRPRRPGLACAADAGASLVLRAGRGAGGAVSPQCLGDKNTAENWLDLVGFNFTHYTWMVLVLYLSHLISDIPWIGIHYI